MADDPSGRLAAFVVDILKTMTGCTAAAADARLAIETDAALKVSVADRILALIGAAGATASADSARILELHRQIEALRAT